MKLHRYSDTAISLYGFLPQDECERLIKKSEMAGYEPAKIDDGAGQVAAPSIRNNSRIIFDDESLAANLYSCLNKVIPQTIDGWTALRLNERFRFYKYERLQAFNWHRDLAYKPSPLEMSKLTFMIYLNDDFEGGFTEFDDFKIWPEAGMAAIFNHKLRHAGSAVTHGTKYVLRSDVIYAAPKPR